MINLKNTKLSNKIIAAMFAGLIVTYALLFIVTNIIVRDLTLNSQKSKAGLILETVLPSIEISLFLGVEDFAEKLGSITRLHEVVGLKVEDTNKKVLLNYQAPIEESLYESIIVTKDIFEPASTKKIASISLSYSGAEFHTTMQRFYIFYSWIFIALIVTLWVMLNWINRLLLPLKLIASKVHNFRPDEKIVFDIPYRQFEFKQIIQAFEAMQERVWSYADKIQIINKDLESKVHEKTQEAVRHLYHDNLTGLPNRFKLQEDLSLLASSSVAILNIDDFKEVNDFFGIEAGDNLLIQVGRWLHDMHLSPYRIGGDEFAFCFTQKQSEQEIIHHVKMILSLLNEKIFIIDQETLLVRATVGIAYKSSKPLIHADVALNHARLLKQIYAVYDHSGAVEAQYQTNIAMTSQIRQALVEHRIVCQYQPIVSLESGKIEKYESLVRIKNEDGTLIGPYEFLSIAQKTKLYHHITREVVYQACTLFANREESFSINLSSSDMLDTNTVSTIENILRQTGTANRVIFEILESEGIENFEQVASFINRMKHLGAKIAIDDFGTGYSNFENILKLNIDIIKIDGSLIKSINENQRHKIVVEAIVNFAHRIGVETVAEFVASEETLQTITQMGITYSQGFHTGKPEFLS
jgi:diguanylate cyclase (GGDEF)-like protein